MADRAVRGISGLNVIGIRGALIILGMARVAIGRSAREFIVDVALVARNVDMETGQRKGSLRVIENGARPRRGGVADGAVRRETGGGMIRIGGSRVVL